MLALPRPALLEGRLAPSIGDIAALARPVLRHRMALTFSARADGILLENVIDRLVERLG
jgi:MoxR-like ATPase